MQKIALLLLLLNNCFAANSNNEILKKRVQFALNHLKEAYEELELIKAEFEKESPTIERFEEAVKLIEKGFLSKARDILILFIKIQNEKTEEAFFLIAETFFTESNYEQAIQFYGEFLMKTKGIEKFSSQRKIAMFRLISCFKTANKIEDICAIIEQIGKEFPELKEKVCSLNNRYACNMEDLKN